MLINSIDDGLKLCACELGQKCWKLASMSQGINFHQSQARTRIKGPTWQPHMRRKHNHFTAYCPRFRSKILHNSSSKLAKLHCFQLSDLEIFVSANHNWQQYFAIFEFKFKYANIIFSVQPIDHPKFLHSVFPLCPRVRWKNSAEKHFQNCQVLLSPF